MRGERIPSQSKPRGEPHVHAGQEFHKEKYSDRFTRVGDPPKQSLDDPPIFTNERADRVWSQLYRFPKQPPGGFLPGCGIPPAFREGR